MWMAFAEAAVGAQMRRAQMHVDGVCRSGGERAHAVGPNSCGRCLRKLRFARKCGGSKIMWTAFAEATVGAHKRRVQFHANRVLQKRRWTRKCGGPKFMKTAFAEAAGARKCG